MTSPTQAMPVQYGTAESADFEAGTWTFRMLGDFKVAAGDFAILPRAEYAIASTFRMGDFYALQDGNARLRTANAALVDALKGVQQEMAKYVYLANHIGINDADGFYLGHAMKVEEAARAALASLEG